MKNYFIHSKRVSSKHDILYSVDKWLEKAVESDIIRINKRKQGDI